MIIIPTFIEQRNISAEEKIRLGKEFTLQAMSGDYIINTEQPEVTAKSESWKDSSIGVLVGPNGRKVNRFKGPFLELFNKVYEEYSRGRDKSKNPKRNAAWAFYNTVIQDIQSVENKTLFLNDLILAARKQATINLDLESKGSTPIQLQGWFTQRRYEDYMRDVSEY